MDLKKDPDISSGPIVGIVEPVDSVGWLLQGVYQWARKLVQPDYCESGADCSSGICKTEMRTCCTDEHCCLDGTSWSQALGMCAYRVGIPNDTPCTAGWPNGQGGEIAINEPNNACDLFEVTDPGLLAIANQTRTCYQNDCKGDCHASCQQAFDEAGANKKKNASTFKEFSGRYIIYGFGPARRYMQGYFNAEINCTRKGTGVCEPLEEFGSNAQQLVCRGPVGQPDGWASDTEMANNSCLFSDLPAHASVSILHTGTCVDYSVAVTTMLRMVGYSKDEVYSAHAPLHEYNLVKFPDDQRWRIVDTVGNDPTPIDELTWKWGDNSQYGHCDYDGDGCSNDAGTTTCPARSEVKGC
jgi:hypothetical protein